MIAVRPGDRDTEVRIERKLASTAFRGAGKETWELLDTEWVELRDILPSRGEQAAGGMPVATRRARLRMDWRSDVLPDMRIVAGDRVMQIVSGPVELGRRAGLEMLVEDYSSTAKPA